MNREGHAGAETSVTARPWSGRTGRDHRRGREKGCSGLGGRPASTDLGRRDSVGWRITPRCPDESGVHDTLGDPAKPVVANGFGNGECGIELEVRGHLRLPLVPGRCFRAVRGLLLSIV